MKCLLSEGGFQFAGFFGEDVDGQVDVFQVGAEGEDGGAEDEASVEDGSGDEDAAVLSYSFRQPPVEGVGVAATGQVAVNGDGEVGQGTDFEAGRLFDALVKVAGEEYLFFQSGAEGGQAGQLQR